MRCLNGCRRRSRRRLITIQRLKADATADTYNEVDESIDGNWETFHTAYLEIKTTGGSEMQHAGQVQAQRRHQFSGRHTSRLGQVTSKMRCRFDSRTFHIEHVENVNEANTEIILHCREKA